MWRNRYSSMTLCRFSWPGFVLVTTSSLIFGSGMWRHWLTATIVWAWIRATWFLSDMLLSVQNGLWILLDFNFRIANVLHKVYLRSFNYWCSSVCCRLCSSTWCSNRINSSLRRNIIVRRMDLHILRWLRNNVTATACPHPTLYNLSSCGLLWKVHLPISFILQLLDLILYVSLPWTLRGMLLLHLIV